VVASMLLAGRVESRVIAAMGARFERERGGLRQDREPKGEVRVLACVFGRWHRGEEPFTRADEPVRVSWFDA